MWLLLLACALIDYDHGVIPDALVLSIFVLGVMRHLLAGEILSPLLASAVGGGVLLLVATVYQRWKKRAGLGMGDIKLLAALGAFLGLSGMFRALLIGSLLGLAFALKRPALIVKNTGRGRHNRQATCLSIILKIYLFEKLFYNFVLLGGKIY